MRHDTRDLTITLSADEANAAVEAICLAIQREGQELDHLATDSPGGVCRLGRRADRISAYAGLGNALNWRKHWGPLGGTPAAVTAPETVWVDLLGELQKRAVELRTCQVDPEDVFEFDTAARTVARAFADAEQVAA